MIYLITIYILFLLLWAGLSYFVAQQLMNYGFVGDATKIVTRLYWVFSGLIIVASLWVIILV
jgi:hypothetical protein